MAEPTDDELKNVIRQIVKKVDLDMCGIKKFTKLLSKECGLDLSHKAKFIKKTLTEVINEDDQEEETSDEEEVAEEKPTKKKQKKKGEGGGGGLAAQKEISAELAAFLGKGDKMARTDIVKELWAYIRENQLQNPENKREIILDDRMKAVFGCDVFTMFTMNKYIGAHIDPFKPVDLTSSNPKKRKAPKEKKENKKKRKSGGSSNSGLQAPYQLSPELSRVVGRQILPRPQVTKKLWEYIRANNLQNPEDKREILCDQKLKYVMGGQEKVTMFSMNRYISPHLLEKLDKSYYVPSDQEPEPEPDQDEDNESVEEEEED